MESQERMTSKSGQTEKPITPMIKLQRMGYEFTNGLAG